VRRETGGESQMKELYEEGIANHLGPEPCAGVREGVGEASVGVRAGRDMEPRKCLFQGADAFVPRGRQQAWRRHRESPGHPAGSKTPARTETHCTGTGRSRRRPCDEGGVVRPGNPDGASQG
jgi:hypothetical protein